jgi:hypothetical protein
MPAGWQQLVTAVQAARAVRGLWPDRNPLPRALDRIEAAVARTLIMAVLAGAPLVADDLRNNQASKGMGGVHAEGYGLIIFAAVLLGLIGFFNLIYGIAAIANAHVFVANAHYVFGSLKSRGWITLIIGAL